MTDLELINNIKNNQDSDSLKDLDFKHSGICMQMIKKYEPVLKNSGIDVNEIYQDKISVVYKSALNFNPSKNVKFSTWLGNQMRYYCLNMLNKNNHFISMDNENIKNIVEKKQPIVLPETKMRENSDLIFDILNQMKDDRALRIFQLRYFTNKNKKLSWHKIAKKINISTQTAINIHNKCLKLLFNKINSQNSFDKI
jgi:RNA polymerase sigma factor (sigma-70 family)